uniref:Uncharacterized protein n=1 Tax=Arundo donax TaxID=35708 RepID=A0A0A9CL52_ARUDO
MIDQSLQTTPDSILLFQTRTLPCCLACSFVHAGLFIRYATCAFHVPVGTASGPPLLFAWLAGCLVTKKHEPMTM